MASVAVSLEVWRKLPFKEVKREGERMGGEGWLSQSLMCTRWPKANTYATINSLTHNTSVQLRAWHLMRLDSMWLIRPGRWKTALVGRSRTSILPPIGWLAGWSALVGWQFVLCSYDLWRPGSWVVIVMDDICVCIFTFAFAYFFFSGQPKPKNG